MIFRSTRRDFLRYGTGIGGLSLLRGQQLPFPGINTSRSTSGGITVLTSQLGPAGSGTTSTMDTTGANGLYIWGAGLNSGITVSDNKGNTWVPTTNFGSPNVTLWYATNGAGTPAVGTGHTFSLSAGGFFSWGVIAAAGMKTSGSLDSWTGNSTSGALVQPGTLNPGSGRHLLIGVFSSGASSGSWSGLDSGFTIANQRNFSSGANYEGGAATLIQASGAAVNPTAAFSGTGNLIFGLFSFGGV
jgi:hypothetical protein